MTAGWTVGVLLVDPKAASAGGSAEVGVHVHRKRGKTVSLTVSLWCDVADPENKSSSMLPDDDDARANAIEERIERLRKLNGWASDTRMVPSEQVEAVVQAMDGGSSRAKAATSKLVLRWDNEKAELSEQHTDVGSGDTCKVRVMDASVSGRHCRISRDGDGFRVRDMNTKTGTWVNEERIPLSSALADGDELRCGEVVFQVQIVADAAPAKPADAGKPAAAAPAKPVAQTIMTSAAALREAAAALGPRPTPGVQQAPAPSAPATRSPISGGRTPRTVSGTHRFSTGQAAPEARAAVSGAIATCFVVYFDAEGIECEAEIPQDRPLVVGRRPTADLRMQDQGISSMHSAFEWVDGEVVVRDLGSTNGTWVHGERVGRAVLEDQDIIRLGLVPVRVRMVAEAAPLEDDEPEPGDELIDEPDESDEQNEPAPVAPEEGAAAWHLVYLTDRGSLATITLDAKQSCVVAGEGKNEISVYGRGLKPEHLQFDWTSSKLEVIQARRDALVKVNGKSVAEAVLHNGDVVSAGTLFIRVVKASAMKSPVGGKGPEFDHWAGLFKRIDKEIELLFVDPDPATGGRTELSIWGDGTAQVEDHSGASSDRYGATLEPEFLKLLFGAIIATGFPDLPSGSQRRAGARPELHAFCGDERAYAVLSDRLATGAPPWREVRDLLRAVTGQILG